MNNKAFRRKCARKRRRKFHAALQRMTRNRLTTEQMRRIGRAVGNRQCHMCLWDKTKGLPSGIGRLTPIWGLPFDPDGDSFAVVVHAHGTDVVWIGLPTENRGGLEK